MRKGEHRGREMKEGEAGRGRLWSKGREEGRRQGDRGTTGRGSRRRRKDGREGDSNAQSVPGMVMHRSMPVVVSIHSVLTCWREGLRVVGRASREPEKEGGISCC